MPKEIVPKILKSTEQTLDLRDEFSALHEKVAKNRDLAKKEAKEIAIADRKNLLNTMRGLQVEVFENEGKRLQEKERTEHLKKLDELEKFFVEVEKEPTMEDKVDSFWKNPGKAFSEIGKQFMDGFSGMKKGSFSAIMVPIRFIAALIEQGRDMLATQIGDAFADMRDTPIVGGFFKSVEKFIGPNRVLFFSILKSASVVLPIQLASFAKGELDRLQKTLALTSVTTEVLYRRFASLLENNKNSLQNILQNQTANAIDSAKGILKSLITQIKEEFTPKPTVAAAPAASTTPSTTPPAKSTPPL